MRSYRRRGRSYVYWMTLPAPNRADFARVYRAVNRAIRGPASRVGRGVRVVDLVPVFTPGGEFRRYVRFRGRRVNARQDDGVHLSVAGAHIAATLLVDRLKADGALQRLAVAPVRVAGGPDLRVPGARRLRRSGARGPGRHAAGRAAAATAKRRRDRDRARPPTAAGCARPSTPAGRLRVRTRVRGSARAGQRRVPQRELSPGALPCPCAPPAPTVAGRRR